MTNDANKIRKNFTLRIKSELSQKIEEEAAKVGISQTAYITMTLHKALQNEDVS
jgi:predicted HicB family RNase H-like nuclease